jgi:hypothetical protein
MSSIEGFSNNNSRFLSLSHHHSILVVSLVNLKSME